MEDNQNSYINVKNSSVFNLSQSSNNSLQLLSPRSRTIEEALRQKYKHNSIDSNISKDNSFSVIYNSPATNLEQLLARSRFTKRSNDTIPSFTPRFLPREAKISIKELERKIKVEKAMNEIKVENKSFEIKNKQIVYNKAIPKQSLELIQKLREELKKRAGFSEPEEPPDIFEMNSLERNKF